MCVFFAVCAGARAPPSKKKDTTPPKQQKNKRAPAPSERVFFAVWAGGRVHFFAVWAGGVLFFCCLGRGRAFCFAFCAGACIFFAVWAGGVFFLLFVRGRDFFFCCLGGGRAFFANWARNGSSLTFRSAWLVFKRPNNKKDQTAKNKKKKRLPYVCIIMCVYIYTYRKRVITP